MIDTKESLVGNIKNKLELIGDINKSEEIIQPTLQEKTTTPTQETQNITPNENYDGLSKVTVNPIPSEYIIPSGTYNITENGEYNIKQYEEVNVNVSQDIPEYLDLTYLYSPPNAYLNTSITATNDIEVEIKFSAGNTVNKPLFGTQAGADYYHVTLYSNAYYWGLNNGEGHGGSITPDINTPHTLIFNNANGQVLADGVVIGNCPDTQSTQKLQLFRRISYYLEGRVYYVIVKNRHTGVELLHLIPKLKYGDGKASIGLLDTLTNTFYKSSGSREFSS